MPRPYETVDIRAGGCILKGNMLTQETLVASTIYLLALINPISKVFFLASAEDVRRGRHLLTVSLEASAVALGILLVFIILGNVLFTRVFHVDIYSFQILGGIVLFSLGYRALTKGVFYETQESHNLSEHALMPLASPLIAGPATITAVIALSAQNGALTTSLATTFAIALNFVVMLLSIFLYKLLRHYNLVGALIRVTGLIVSMISVQMILEGLRGWIATL
jgi:multiple antibiotic resistance protein